MKFVTVVSYGGRMARGDTNAIGRLLLESNVLPVEILSVLLLVSMVGAILITKKDLR